MQDLGGSKSDFMSLLPWSQDTPLSWHTHVFTSQEVHRSVCVQSLYRVSLWRQNWLKSLTMWLSSISDPASPPWGSGWYYLAWSPHPLTDKSLKKSEDSENPHLRYNWLHVKQINNVLLYSTGNYIQNPVINCNWKEYEREYIYTHTYIHIKWNHFSVHQQLTQHCKSTIIKKKRKERKPSPTGLQLPLK